jgi:hypothetical protein
LSKGSDRREAFVAAQAFQSFPRRLQSGTY